MNSFSTTLFCVLLASSVPCFGQTGVGTTTPAQTLEIGGTSSSTTVGTTGIKLVTPTVRIDGLNGTNNPVHKATDGVNSLKRVYATQNGDLVLVDSTLERLTNQQFGDAVIPNSTLTSLLGVGVESPSLKSQTFTLTEASIVNISASLNVQFSTILTDGTAKIYGAYFRFSAVPSGSGISTTGNFGRNEKSYTNATSTGATGNYMISPRADLVLPKGTYTVNLYGYVQGGALTFTANFANSTTGGENLIITASPTLFQ